MKNQRFINKSFDLGTASAIVLVAFGAEVVFQLIFALFGLPKNVYTWICVIANQLIFFGVALTFCFVKKVDLLAVTGAKTPPKWYFFPIFALIAICCVTAFAPMSGLFSRLLNKVGYGHEPQYFIPMENGGLFTLAFFALTLLPALGEETLIRGVLMSGAKKKSPLFAIFFTAIIFALLHGNLHQLLHQFLLGAVMGYLVYLTGGIYASATVHFVNNGFALLLDYGRAHNFVDKMFYWYVGGKLGAEPTIIGMSVSLFALVMLLVLVTCLWHRNRAAHKEYTPSEGRLFTRITSYLIYLSTPTTEAEAQEKAEQGNKTDGFSRMMAILLAVVFAAVVLLTLIPGGEG